MDCNSDEEYYSSDNDYNAWSDEERCSDETDLEKFVELLKVRAHDYCYDHELDIVELGKFISEHVISIVKYIINSDDNVEIEVSQHDYFEPAYEFIHDCYTEAFGEIESPEEIFTEENLQLIKIY
jgi:hypothetical protein